MHKCAQCSEIHDSYVDSCKASGVRIVHAKKGETDSVVYVFIDGIRLECRAPTWASALIIATRIAKTMGVKFEPEDPEDA